MEQYDITGMSCAACSARIEKAVSKVEGVSSCSVSLLTNSMGVEGSADPGAIIKAVTEAGYGASLRGEKSGSASGAGDAFDPLADRETPALKKRLIASLILLVPLMYISMGHMTWGFPLPGFLESSHAAIALAELLLSAIIMVINQKFFINGFRSLFHLAPNMDTLVALGSSASFVWSVTVLFRMIIKPEEGLMNELYFESAAMILALITVGKTLEARSKGKTTDALKGLMKLSPKTALLIKDGKEITLPVEQVSSGDIFAVKPGENIPVDGEVVEGISAVNESALTGESVPVDKSEGDRVFAGTLNQSGYIKCRATGVGKDTTLSQIIKMVSDAAATKAPIAKIADRVSGIFVPVVITIAVITFAAWMIAGESAAYSLARAISVLVISCPCALGLATPVAIMVGNGKGARNGILFKTSESLENLGKVDIIALDKTGTLTKGEPEVTDVIPAGGYSKEGLIALAASLEIKSEHPLAKAIIRYADERKTVYKGVDGFEALPGNGVFGKDNGRALAGGSVAFIKSRYALDKDFDKKADSLAAEGKTPLIFAKDGDIAGIIAVADRLKDDGAKAVSELRGMGLRAVMLTGDNAVTANAIGKAAGVDEVIAGVLPDGKESVIRDLQKQGKVAMVGDGINDAPALTRADIGIAIGAGTDVAIDAADVVLMKSSLSELPAAIRLSRATLRNIKENLFWAFIYNTVGIPIAAGLFIKIFGWTLNPMFGAAAMSLSSFCVVTNALRLNLFRLYDSKHDKKRKIKKRGNDKMSANEKTMNVKGMMCAHCEARVKKALEAIPGVTAATPNHVTGLVKVTLSAPVDDAVLKKAVEDQDYEVVSIG